MKLKELLKEEANNTKGTYAAVRFDDATKKALTKYIEDNNIPNPTDMDKLHCTVLYSRKYCPDYEPMGDIVPPWIGTPSKLEVWNTQGKLRDEETKRCLVLKFDCKQLNDRHNKLMDEHQATYDYPEYKTHVTLSYDIGEMEIDDLPDVTKAIKQLVICHEYGEDLDLDWTSKASSK